MKRKVRVEVTRHDTENGYMLSCSSCPVAIAVKRAVSAGLTRRVAVEVHMNFARVYGDHPWEARLPSDVQMWISLYDSSGVNVLPAPPKPFTLTFVRS